MDILIIGGSGFIGTETFRLFSRNGLKPVSFDKMPTNGSIESYKCVAGDVLDLPSVERILAEYSPDTILHLVGLPVIEACEKNPNLSYLLNVESVQNTLEAMRLHDVRKIVFSSSACVYGTIQSTPIRETDLTQPTTIYGYHKLVAEQMIKSYSESYGINYVILRIFNVYGANPAVGKDVISIFIRAALKGEPLCVKGSNKYRDFVRVDDVAMACLKAQKINGPSNVLNIASGTRTSLGEIAKMVKEYFPKIEIIEETVQDDGTGLLADINMARNILGFDSTQPGIGIRSYISKYALDQKLI